MEKNHKTNTEVYRPKLHFTAKKGWINDPNGLIYTDGIYHMFFQHDPSNITPEHMHWGHAVSTDMIHWQEKEIALYPDDRGSMWSGSAIVDKNNLLGKNTDENAAVLLYYTTTKPFVQNISYSTDGFKTIHHFEGNPVVEHIMGTNRDPKVVFCDELDCYVMILHLKGQIYALLKSENLTDWSEFQRIENLDSECPDIFPLLLNDGTRKWVIMGAGDNYLVGDFVNGKFMPSQPKQLLHYGNVAYAGQTFSNLEKGRIVRIVWNRNWNFDTKTFAGQMGIPMDLSLCMHNGKYYIGANPINEIEKLYLKTDCCNNLFITPESEFDYKLENSPYLIKIKTEMQKSGNVELGFFGVETVIDFDKQEIHIADLCAPLSVTNENVDITLIIDRCSTEIFADGGKIYMSCLTDCNPDFSELFIKSNSEIKIERLELHSLDSVY